MPHFAVPGKKTQTGKSVFLKRTERAGSLIHTDNR